jgi:predicted dehydrogenase
MVGFNRRFAPHLQQIVPLLRAVDEPKAMVMTINAGPLPQESWVHDPSVGGGRIAGEACHFIDLLRHLCGHPIIAVQATGIEADRVTPARRDCMTITLSFADGSTGTIHYLANGHRALAKERLEVFVAGRVIQLDNFRRLRTFGCQAPGRKWLWRQDKGHRAAAAAFINAVRGGGASPIPIREILEVTAATLDVLSAAAAGATVRCGDRASQQSNTTAPTFDLRLRAA